MPSRRFSGVVRLQQFRAKLETKRGAYVLNPYPQQAGLSNKAMEKMGRDLFEYFDGKAVDVEGSLSADVIYNARLAESGEAVQDVKIAPESTDRFSVEIEQHFQKDSSEIAAKLNDIGIRTVSALYHRIRDDKREVTVFAKYLKVREERIKEFLDGLEQNADNQALVRSSPRRPVKRGVNLKMLAEVKGVPAEKKAPSAPPKFPASAITPDLPSKVDLTVHVTPVKDQGMRGTCVAHAAAACLEAEFTKKGAATTAKLDLSEQYLYWACKNIDGSPRSEGTFIEYAVEVLVNGVARKKLAGGVCNDKAWPYNKLPAAGNESQDPPTPKALKAFRDNKQHRAMNYTKLNHHSIKALKSELAAGHCVGLSVYTYHFWTDDFAWREGVISLPLGIEPDGAHAVCLVGYRDNDATHGDGYFIFKNSWDVQWGFGRPDPGYGSLPYRYVLKEAIEAYSLEA
jgi:C1A family cysteine protease